MELTTKPTTECTKLAPILPPTLKQFAKILTFGLGKQASPLNSLVSHEGNLKIPSTTAIFCMGAATDCPSMKLGLCKAAKSSTKCYALKSEYSYRPFVLPYRRRQEHYWKSVTAEQFVADFLLMNALKETPFQSLRMNESGDFWTQDCVDKAEKIAAILARFGIKVYCYTSRSDLSFKNVKNLIVSGSGFRKKGITNEFKIIHSIEDKPKGYGLCRGNCKTCNRCLTRGKLTAVLAH